MKGLKAAPLLIWGSALLLCSAYLFTGIRFSSDMADLLPRAENSTHQIVVDQIRDGPASQLLLIGIEGSSPTELALLSKVLRDWMETSQLFQFADNGEGNWTAKDTELLVRYRYILSPTIRQSRFEVASLRRALSSRVEEFASPLATVVKSFIPMDPTGEVLAIRRYWGADVPRGKFHGVWMNQAQPRAILFGKTKAPGLALDQQENLQTALQDEFARLVAALDLSSQPQLIVTGPAVFAVEARQIIQRDARLLSTIAAAMVVALLWMLYRSIFLLLFILIPIGSAILIASTVVGLLFSFIHGITIAFGITLIGVTVDYPLHFFSHLTQEQSSQGVIKKIWPTLRLGMVTTALGFTPMVFSDNPGLEQLGCFAIVGLLSAGLVSRWILPSLLPRQYVPRVSSMPFLLRIVQARKSWSWPIIGGVILSLAAISWSGTAVWETDIANLSPISEEQKSMDRTLRRALGAPDTRDFLVITATTSQEVLVASEKLMPILENFIKKGYVQGYDMAAKYLPSIQTQRSRKLALPDEETMKTRLREALTGLPFAKGIFTPFLHAVSETQRLPFLEQTHLKGTHLGEKVAPLLFELQDRWVGLVLLQGVTNRRMVESISSSHPGQPNQLAFVDVKAESAKMLTQNRDQILYLVGWGALGILCVLWMGLGSIATALRVCLPTAGGVGTAMVLLLGLGYRLSFFHIASLLLVMGIGLDYALFFNRTHRDSHDFERTFFSIIACSLTTMCGFGVLAFSEIPVLKAIGLTVFFGAAACLYFTACTGRRPSVPS